MKSEKLKTSDSGAGRLFDKLAREKKKTICALCLIAVMVFMWVRMLGGKTPQSAAAAPIMQEMAKSQSNPESKVSFTELPKIEGRNDVLTRDFFAVNSWREFIKGRNNPSGIEVANVVSEDGGEEYAKQIIEKLKLETIVMGQNPEAFINDKLLGIGDKLLVGDGIGAYECEVTGIEENTVYIRCGKAKITLKLVQTVGATD